MQVAYQFHFLATSTSESVACLGQAHSGDFHEQHVVLTAMYHIGSHLHGQTLSFLWAGVPKGMNITATAHTVFATMGQEAGSGPKRNP